MAMTQAEKDYIESVKTEQGTCDGDVVTDKLSREEREIVLVYNEGERVWYADTSIPKFWRKLEKKGWECIRTQYYADGTVCCKSFRGALGSSRGVTITDPFKKREFTEEQRQKVRERFAKKNTDDVEDILEDFDDDESDGVE